MKGYPPSEAWSSLPENSSSFEPLVLAMERWWHPPRVELVLERGCHSALLELASEKYLGPVPLGQSTANES